MWNLRIKATFETVSVTNGTSVLRQLSKLCQSQWDYISKTIFLYINYCHTLDYPRVVKWLYYQCDCEMFHCTDAYSTTQGNDVFCDVQYEPTCLDDMFGQPESGLTVALVGHRQQWDDVDP